MKLSKVDIDNMAKALSDKLLASPGLKDAKKIVNQVKKNLAAEYKRRKNYDKTKRLSGHIRQRL